MADRFTSVDEYVASLPADAQAVVTEIRRTIREAVPDGVEAISYQIPTMKLDGRNLVHFAAWTAHVSVYPVPATDDPQLAAEIDRYRVSKGTLRFPLDEPVPYDFVARVVDALVDQRDAQSV